MKKFSLFSFIVLFLSVNISQAQDSLKNITLEDIWTNYSFYPHSVRGINSLSNGQQYTSIKKGSVVVYNYKSGDSVTTLLKASELIPKGEEGPIKLGSFSMSKDETKFLIPTETEAIYRHSSVSKYYVWDTDSKKLSNLSSDKQRLADFSLDGSKVAFVRDNNIFIKNIETGKELQLTSDGKFNSIINGTCDWVYEEEFGFTKAFFWSPDGKKIAYYRFDESRVKEYTLTTYAELYPELYTYKYPKAGEDNSLVEIFVYNLESGTSVKMDIGKETDQYIPRIKWTQDPNVLSIQRLNRLQNHLEILLADATNGTSQIIYSEDNKYYIDITDDLTFLPGNKLFLITSEKDGYKHLYLYNIDGTLNKQLTTGNWEVSKVYGYDTKKKQVFYQSSEGSPLNRDIYFVTL
jgi:dipeptidyl-peptidase-4